MTEKPCLDSPLFRAPKSLHSRVSPLRKAITRGLLALIVACFVWGFLIEPSRLVVHETTVPLPAWPRALDGFKIALLSDIHAGAPFIREEKLAAIVAEANGTTPDLILLAGDFVVGNEPLSRRIEPDSFPDIPARVALTLAGHTHGGQVALPLLGGLVVPSRYGRRYAAGHVVEGGKHLFVTSEIGTSILPVRFGVTPEIALLTLVAAP